jgi:hypothetical protein
MIHSVRFMVWLDWQTAFGRIMNPKHCPALTGVRHLTRDQHSLSISTQTYMALAYFEDSSLNTSTITFNHCSKTIGRSNLISLNPTYEGKILGLEYPSDITPPGATARLPYVQPLGGLMLRQKK